VLTDEQTLLQGALLSTQSQR